MVLTVTRDDITRIEAEECIVLKDGLTWGDGSKLIDYKVSGVYTPCFNKIRDLRYCA